MTTKLDVLTSAVQAAVQTMADCYTIGKNLVFLVKCPRFPGKYIVYLLISDLLRMFSFSSDTEIEPLQYETAGEKCNILRYVLISSDMTESI